MTERYINKDTDREVEVASALDRQLKKSAEMETDREIDIHGSYRQRR